MKTEAKSDERRERKREGRFNKVAGILAFTLRLHPKDTIIPAIRSFWKLISRITQKTQKNQKCSQKGTLVRCGGETFPGSCSLPRSRIPLVMSPIDTPSQAGRSGIREQNVSVDSRGQYFTVDFGRASSNLNTVHDSERTNWQRTANKAAQKLL